MTQLAIEPMQYRAPEGLVDLGDRVVQDKKFILYVGEKAFVDIVEITEVVNSKEVLGSLVTRAESTPDRALDLLHHTSLFLSVEDNARIFDGPAAQQ
jgi:hypothetical protein